MFQFQVKLERILGLTVPNNAGLASAPSRGLVAYPAGCTVVLYNNRKNRQSHVINPSRKTITSLAFSDDGRYMVTGECGHAPCVRIWDVAEKQQISEFPGHKYGVNVVAFAPNGKYVVSVGSQQDMIGMAIPVVEFSREGYKIKQVFGKKINCSLMKLLSFANWCNVEGSKRAEI